MTYSLEEIRSNGLCQGCGGCAAALPGRLEMRLSHGGYLRPYPLSPLTPEEDAKIDSVCSGVHVEHESPPGPDYHPLWGPLLHVRTGWANDPEVRFTGSSGGVISALALHLIDSGQVDYVLHVSSDPTDPFGSHARPSLGRADVLDAAGSRYGPSAPLADLDGHLSSGRRFAVVGKPCDIVGLRLLARQDARIDQQIPLMIAFMCAGVPSRVGTMKVVEKLGAEPKRVRRFAYRGQGWPGFARAVLDDGSERRMDYATSWGTVLNQHLQFRFKICPDGVGEFADIVSADAWYGVDGYPDFEEREGRSLVLTRTVAGEALVQSACRAGSISVEALDVGEIERMQPYQAARKRSVLARVMGMRAAGQLTPRFLRLMLLPLALSVSPMVQWRNFKGAFRRSGSGRETMAAAIDAKL